MLFLKCVLTESHSSFDLGSLSPFRTTLLCKSSLSGSLSLLLSSEILSLSLTISSCDSGSWNISDNNNNSRCLMVQWESHALLTEGWQVRVRLVNYRFFPQRFFSSYKNSMSIFHSSFQAQLQSFPAQTALFASPDFVPLVST